MTTPREMLEAVAQEIASAKCDSLLPASLIAWERRIRTIAASLEGQAAVPEWWSRFVANAAASLDKRGDRQMASRMMELHTAMTVATKSEDETS